ncbi:MAG: hypothetical protein M3N10_04185 [Actinomycetota bacterium]|nr:hypothetical protein [Actinomycetota bacterium]
MAQTITRRFTTQTEEPFVVFLIGMRLPLHKDPAAVTCGMTQARPTGASHSTPTV